MNESVCQIVFYNEDLPEGFSVPLEFSINEIKLKRALEDILNVKLGRISVRPNRFVESVIYVNEDGFPLCELRGDEI